MPAPVKPQPVSDQRFPHFPARLAARGPRWLRQAVAPPAQPPINHRSRQLCHSARSAACSFFCSAACGDVLAAATPSATDARAAPRTVGRSRRWYQLPDKGEGGSPMLRTRSWFAHEQRTKAGRARPPPGVRCRRRTCRGRLRRSLGRRNWLRGASEVADSIRRSKPRTASRPLQSMSGKN